MKLNKILLFSVAILLIFMTFGCTDKDSNTDSGVSEAQIKAKYAQLQESYNEKGAQGYDLSEVESLLLKAKKAYDEKDYSLADTYLDDALSKLEELEETHVNITPIPVPEDVPAEYQQFYNTNKAFLDRKIVEYKPDVYGSMKFGTLFPPLSYGGEMYQTDTKFSYNYLSYLDELELDIIRIDPYYDIWLDGDSKHIEIVDQVVDHIKDSNYELMIADASAEQYQNAHMSWSEYRSAHIDRVQTLAGRYKPDYYVIVKEAMWYDQRGNIETTPTPDQWAELIKVSADTVKTASPSTKVAVAFVPHEEQELFEKVLEIDDVDIMGFDIYDKDWSLPASEEMTVQAKEKGKQVWILETWLYHLPSTNMNWKKDIDAQWITTSVYFAANNNLDGYLPFYTVHFFSYGDKQIEETTPSFYAYSDVVKEVRGS